MLGGLRAVLPAALMHGLAASAMSAGMLRKQRISDVTYPPPRKRKSYKPGDSPAIAGPHSEPRVHVRSSIGGHYWFTQERWDAVRFAKVPFRLMAGDVIERVDGYGAVTKRERVPL